MPFGRWKDLASWYFSRGGPRRRRPCFARGVGVRPDSARLHANLGEALRILGRLDEALDHLRKALALDASFAQAWNSLGLLAYDQRRFADAESACREAIRLKPRFAAAYINLGNALQALRRPAEAVEAMRTALRIEPDNFLGLTNLGQVLSELGDPDLLDEAEALCRRAEALAPQLPQAPENLGNVLRLQRPARGGFGVLQAVPGTGPSPRDALSLHRATAPGARTVRRSRPALRNRRGDLEPGDARFLTDLGGLSAAREQYDQAADALPSGRRCSTPSSPRLISAWAGLLSRAGSTRLRLLSRGVANRPKPGGLVGRAGPALVRAWRLRPLVPVARSALAVRPKLADAYWRLALNLKGRLPEADVQAIEGLLDHQYLAPAVRAELHFALGAVLDARGLHARAATCFDIANKLQSSARAPKGQSYDPDVHSRFIDRMIATFTPEFLDDRRGWGDPDPRPVFVVGMPRSGTTLVEQILASHPQVHGAGELADVHNDLSDAARGRRSVRPVMPSTPWLPSAARFGKKGGEALSRAARCTLAPATAVRVVDKMPDNIRLLGLIALLWPNARVIVCGRDLRDIAVSCRQTDFAVDQVDQ